MAKHAHDKEKSLPHDHSHHRETQAMSAKKQPRLLGKQQERQSKRKSKWRRQQHKVAIQLTTTRMKWTTTMMTIIQMVRPKSITIFLPIKMIRFRATCASKILRRNT